MIMEEVWADISGYDGFYKVSNLGNIKSLQRYVKCKDGSVRLFQEKILSGGKAGRGYLLVTLFKGAKKRMEYVHRLVAEAFIPNVNNYPQINHKNGIKTDNRVENLEWCNNSMNMKHAFKTGLAKTTIYQVIEKNKKKVIQLTKDGKFVSEYNSVIDAAKENNFNFSNIARCCRNCYGSKSYKGYIWRYKEDSK
jgi:hypothetical protein